MIKAKLKSQLRLKLTKLFTKLEQLCLQEGCKSI